MIKQEYVEQVSLLTSILPFIAEEKCFVLKGGTAINLFYQNLPGLSVDIDLAYIDFDTRDKTYKNINDALERINIRLNKTGIANIDKLPAIKWKVQNLEKLKSINPDKFKKEYQEIKKIFD